MTKKAIKKRGYNQSESLARIVSKSFGCPVVNCIEKIKNSSDQIGLDGNARWENLSYCFKLIDSKKISEKNILLIDDVITTGATAYYCAKEILNYGANAIIVLTAAKSMYIILSVLS